VWSFRTNQISQQLLDKNQSGLHRLELRSCKKLKNEQSHNTKFLLLVVLLIQHRGHKLSFLIRTQERNYAVIPKVFLNSSIGKSKNTWKYLIYKKHCPNQANSSKTKAIHKNFGVFSSKKKNCYFQQKYKLNMKIKFKWNQSPSYTPSIKKLMTLLP